MTSLCNSCRKPGACCFGFEINHPSLNRMEDPSEVERFMLLHDDGKRVGMPFKPFMKKTFKNGATIWKFWCPNLDMKTGRCSDYENRPVTCEIYEPGCDPLCAMHTPATAEKVDE